MNITKEDFESYEAVRKSGVTNMFMIGTVSDLSGLDKTVIKHIMINYTALTAQFDMEQVEENERVIKDE